MSNVKIHCSHTEVRELAKLVEHPRNPNKHPESQLQLLGKIIASAGWRAPIVVSRRSGYIIKGHGRFQAALMAGMEVAPVDLQDYATEAEEWADMIADNRIAELSEISLPELKDLLQEMDTGEIDMDLTGWDEAALAGLMTQTVPEEEPKPALGEMWEIAIECSGEAEQLNLLDRFKKEGLKCRALTF